MVFSSLTETWSAVFLGAGLSPSVFITAEADLSSSFSQSGLQSRSPEAILNISDPESLEVTVLSVDEVCAGDGRVEQSLGCGRLSEYKRSTPSSSILGSLLILMQPGKSVPGGGPAVGPGHLCVLVTSKLPSSISPSLGLSQEAWIWLATQEKGVNSSLGTAVKLSRCKASSRGVYQHVCLKVRGR